MWKLALSLVLAAAYGCADAQYHATSYAAASPRYSGQAARYYWPSSSYNYYYKRPTAAAAATTTYNTVSDANGGSAGPWWRSFFPGASLPGEREIFPEWFEVDEADQCDQVPDSVNTGRPRDLCGDDDLGSRFCICMKRPRYGSLAGHVGAATYQPICGECRDPCALRFIPDSFPRKERSGEDYDDENNSGGNSRRRNQ